MSFYHEPFRLSDPHAKELLAIASVGITAKRPMQDFIEGLGVSVFDIEWEGPVREVWPDALQVVAKQGRLRQFMLAALEDANFTLVRGRIQALLAECDAELSTEAQGVDPQNAMHRVGNPQAPRAADPVPPRQVAAGERRPWFEDLPLDFTRQETRSVEQLLIVGYPFNMAAISLAVSAGLNPADLNQMAPVRFLMREILEKARTADRLPQLLADVLGDPGQTAIHSGISATIAGHEATIEAAALQRKPSLATMALLPPSVEVWRAGAETAESLAASGLEKIVNAAAGFADPAVFRLRLVEAEVRTARIEIGGKAKGTGFLISPQLLLTNWHVVAAGAQGALARFDHKSNGRDADPEKGRAVPFADDWLVAHSEFAARPVELGPDGPPDGYWDFAVVRLREPVGSQTIGAEPVVDAGQARGWYDLDGGAYDFADAEPILILGHPQGRPAQLSYASPAHARLTAHENRVRYETNTEGGSSGSPVFNRDWRVVALHHGAGPTATPGEFDQQASGFNQGIPVSGIVTELRAQLAGRSELEELGLGDG